MTPDETFLREYLVDRDVLCPGCGYNLRNLTSAFCPECGLGLQLSVRLVEPKQGALIGGLIGLAAGAGLGGLLLIYLAIALIKERSAGPWFSFALINGVGFAVHAGAVLMWVRNWNRIRTAPASLRRLLVGICWAMPLAFVIVFACYIK